MARSSRSCLANDVIIVPNKLVVFPLLFFFVDDEAKALSIISIISTVSLMMIVCIISW